MRKSLAAVAFAVVILLGASAFASTITINDSNFSTVLIAPGCGTYVYQGGGCQDLSSTGWNFSTLIPGVSGAGLISSTDVAFPPQSFAGLPAGTTQTAFLQDVGSVSQSLTGFTAGQTYDLSFYLGSRPSMGNQTVQVQIGNATVLFALNSNTPFTLEHVYFTASGTGELLTFTGTDPLGGDNTAFLTDVSITATPEPVTLVLFGTGLAGIGGIVRRRLTK